MDKEKTKDKIRINLEIDPEVNPKLFNYFEKINKRKRASLLRRLLEETIKQ